MQKLAELIKEYPDLPIVVAVDVDDDMDDGYRYLLNVTNAKVREVFSHPDYGRFEDREWLEDFLYDKYVWLRPAISDTELKEMVEAEMTKLEQFWTKVIVIYTRS